MKSFKSRSVFFAALFSVFVFHQTSSADLAPPIPNDYTIPSGKPSIYDLIEIRIEISETLKNIKRLRELLEDAFFLRVNKLESALKMSYEKLEVLRDREHELMAELGLLTEEEIFEQMLDDLFDELFLEP